MRWNERISTGTVGKYSWLVAGEMIRELPAMTAEFHAGQRLCITAFDSGPLKPSEEERRIGWSLLDDAMVSPPLSSDIKVPCDNFDEWYVFRELPTSLEVSDHYVNYPEFNLTQHSDVRNDWLPRLKRQFWSDIDRLAPSSYISSGNADIVVTSQPEFFEQALDAARRSTGELSGQPEPSIMQAFVCSECPLAFEIGGYVYWDHDGDTDRLVCIECGTMHWLDFRKAPTTNDGATGTTTFRALPGPTRAIHAVTRTTESGDEYLDYEWQFSADDWIAVATWPNRRSLESLACNHCHTAGKLISLETPRNEDGSWPIFRDKDRNEHCPVCKGPIRFIYDQTIN